MFTALVASVKAVEMSVVPSTVFNAVVLAPDSFMAEAAGSNVHVKPLVFVVALSSEQVLV
jgi:hypothetical protein